MWKFEVSTFLTRLDSKALVVVDKVSAYLLITRTEGWRVKSEEEVKYSRLERKKSGKRKLIWPFSVHRRNVFIFLFSFHLTSPDYNTWLMKHKFFYIKLFLFYFLAARNKLRFFVFAAIFFQLDVCQKISDSQVECGAEWEQGLKTFFPCETICEKFCYGEKFNSTIIILMQKTAKWGADFPINTNFLLSGSP